MAVIDFSITSDAPEFTSAVGIIFTVTHCGFFLFNFLNLLYILLIEGFVFQRLNKNFLLKLSSAASFFQILSCISSIYRSNIMDPYGPYGKFGAITSFFAYVPMNTIYLYVTFQRNQKAIRFGVLLWLLFTLVDLVVTLLNWEEKNFAYFRIYVAASTLFQLVSSIIGYFSIRNGSMTINSSIISTNGMLRLSKVIIGIYIVCLALSASGIVIFIYPATGMTFTMTLITALFVGRADFMLEGNSGELKPIINV